MPPEPPGEPSVPPMPSPPDVPPMPVGSPVDRAATPAQPPAPTRRRRTWIALVVAFAVVAATVGGAAALLHSGPRHGDLLELVPADAGVVATAYLEPSAGQKANLLRLAARFPVLANRADLTRRVNDELDSALRELGLDHTDVQGWVGSQIAVEGSMTGSSAGAFALLVDATDLDKAQAALDKVRAQQGRDGVRFTAKDHDGVTVQVSSSGEAYAVVDGAVVAGDEPAVDGVIDVAHGKAADLASSAAFQSATAGLPDGRLALLFVAPQQILDFVQNDPALNAVASTGSLASLTAVRGFAMSVSAEPNGIAADLLVSYDPSKLDPATRAALSAPDHPNALLDYVPATAYAVIAQPHATSGYEALVAQAAAVSPSAAKMLRKLHLLGPGSALDALTGDVVIEVSPGVGAPIPGGALLIGTTDGASMQAFLDAAAQAATRELSTPFGPGFTKKEATALPKTALTQGPRIDVLRPTWKTVQYKGVSIRYLSGGALPVTPAYAVVGGAGVIATSPDEIRRLIDAKDGGSSITSSSTYTTALSGVPSSDGVLYVNVAAVADAIRAALPPDLQAGYDHDVKPNLDPISSFVVGTEAGADHQHVRILVAVG